MVIPASKPKVTSTEKKFRQEQFPDVKEIKNLNVLCTSCGSSVKDLITKGKPIVHPFLETLLCEKCDSFYGDGQFSVDEDGSDKYCRWCGQGGTLFLCSKCTAGFCKRCVKRNLPKSAQTQIEDDNWVCYCCDTSPLYELRAQGWAAQQYSEEYVKVKASSKNKKSIKRAHEDENSDDESIKSKGKKVKKDKARSKKRTRDSDQSESDEEVRKSSRKKEQSHSTDSDNSSNIESLKNKKSAKENDKKAKVNDKKSRVGNKKVNGNIKEKGEVRTLRKRESKVVKDSDNKLLPSGIPIRKINSAMTQMSCIVGDIASITKEAHKKLLECKIKKINIENINSVETVIDVQKKLSSMMTSLETNIKMVRKGMEGYIVEWCKTVENDKAKVANVNNEESGEVTSSPPSPVKDDSVIIGEQVKEELSAILEENMKDNSVIAKEEVKGDLEDEVDIEKTKDSVDEETQEVESNTSPLKDDVESFDVKEKDTTDEVEEKDVNKSDSINTEQEQLTVSLRSENNEVNENVTIEGDDSISAIEGDDSISAIEGDDSISAIEGDDSISAVEGDDSISAVKS